MNPFFLSEAGIFLTLRRSLVYEVAAPGERRRRPVLAKEDDDGEKSNQEGSEKEPEKRQVRTHHSF
jgi:hypothetical protein